MWPTVPPNHPGWGAGSLILSLNLLLSILGSSFHIYLLKTYYVPGPVPGDASGSSQTPASKAGRPSVSPD